MKYTHVSLYTVDVIFSLLDRDNSGSLGFYELLVAIVDPILFLKHDYVVKAFKAFDVDVSGSISIDEMQ